LNAKEKIIEIGEILKVKSREKCGGNWEFNGKINFHPLEAKSFYNKILKWAREVYGHKNSQKKILEIIYGNEFKELVKSNDVEIKIPQNIQMFMTKFRGVNYDFKWELIWSCM